ncbi:pentapeptide repeat-containing protein [Actinacidiphila sp. DG2A-62]|uniref:pentapeptide repeat-containing protein n=1 Tax=Actinacidiphila sp. DG2A-62 TaxID=3108821 RepID=UPI003FA35F44
MCSPSPTWAARRTRDPRTPAEAPTVPATVGASAASGAVLSSAVLSGAVLSGAVLSGAVPSGFGPPGDGAPVALSRPAAGCRPRSARRS